VFRVVAAIAFAARARLVAGVAAGGRFFVPTPRVFAFAGRRLVDPSQDEFPPACAVVLKVGVAEGGGLHRPRNRAPPLVRGGHRVCVLGQEGAALDAAHVVGPGGGGRFSALVAAHLRQFHGEDVHRAGVAQPHDGPLHARAAGPPQDRRRALGMRHEVRHRTPGDLGAAPFTLLVWHVDLDRADTGGIGPADGPAGQRFRQDNEKPLVGAAFRNDARECDALLEGIGPVGGVDDGDAHAQHVEPLPVGARVVAHEHDGGLAERRACLPAHARRAMPVVERGIDEGVVRGRGDRQRLARLNLAEGVAHVPIPNEDKLPSS